MKFPAYGRSLLDRRLLGERPRVVYLLVGDRWRLPEWLPSGIPRLAVKTAPWHREMANESPESLRRKESARHAVRDAISNGRLVRNPCEVCGHGDSEAHHPSYQESRWLDVRWLCQIHHTAAHAVLRRTLQAETFDWRVVVAMTVLAIDVRRESELQYGDDGWDSWLWLLANVQRYARDVLLFTPTIEFHDPPNGFAPERSLDLYAYLNRGAVGVDGTRPWPPWWPYGEHVAGLAA